MDKVNILVMAPILGSDPTTILNVDDPAIRILDGNAAFLAELEAQGVHTFSPAPDLGPPQPLEERNALLAQADVLLIGYPVLREVVSRAPRLRWVHHTAAGASNFWDSDLWTSQITLTTGRGSVAPTSIAQYIIAGVLFFSQGLFDAYLDKRSGRLDRSHYQSSYIPGATMGIVGLGGIGKEVARITRLFSMRVVATRRSVQSPQQNVDGVDLLLLADQLAEMAAQCDFLAVCAQLTKETQGLINERIFASMKPASILINVARGELVDEDALIEALQRGRIRGAVLDVYQGELEGKQPRSELMGLPQVLVTPHISSSPAELKTSATELFKDNLRRFRNGEPLINVVDRSRGY